jgi:hypothetical protein
MCEMPILELKTALKQIDEMMMMTFVIVTNHQTPANS